MNEAIISKTYFMQHIDIDGKILREFCIRLTDSKKISEFEEGIITTEKEIKTNAR